MIDINISPFEKCGAVVAGSTYAEVSKMFVDHESFTKGPFSTFVTSSVLDGSLHVYYSETGICVGVEIFHPLRPIWDGINLFSGNLKDLTHIMFTKGQNIEIEDPCVEFSNLGFSTYSSNFDDRLICIVDSIYVNLIN